MNQKSAIFGSGSLSGPKAWLRRSGPQGDFACSLIAFLIAAVLAMPAAAQEDAKAADAEPAAEKPAAKQEAPSQPIGRLIELQSPIEGRSIAAVRNAGIELAAESSAEGRDAVLVLMIPPGTSQYHDINGLVSELIKIQRTGVKTVAWVPNSVSGYNAMLVFACREVILHPDVIIGDFGRGEAIDTDQIEFIRSKANQLGLPKRPASLAVAMADPDRSLLQVDIEKPINGGAINGGTINGGAGNGDPVDGNVGTERRLVLKTELKELQNAGVVIRDTKVISEAGSALSLSADECRRMGVLATSVADTIEQVVADANLSTEVLRSGASGETPSKVRKIPVQGVIDQLLGSFLSRQIDRAVAEGADLIIFEVESPGGLKFVSQDLADQIADLADKDIRTVAWVPNQALSGAAIISLGCDQIIMAPDAVIGDAGAIAMNGDGAFERVPEKVVSPFRVEMANLAERKGRPPAILMAMVDRNLEVFEVKHAVTGRTWYMTEDEIHKAGDEWVKGRLVAESRKEDLLLTADGERAYELKIAEPAAADFDEVRARLGLPADITIKEIERSWVDDFVVILNSPFIVGLLFFLGIMCIYLELHTMTGIFGIGAILCFALYFWSKMLGGTAGSLEVVLFLLGFALIACEIFVIPGFGVAGVTGILLVIASLVMAAQTFRGLDASETFAASGQTLGQLAGAIVGVIVVGALLSKYLPQIPMFSAMVLAPPGASLPNGDEVRLRPELTEANSAASGPEIGSTGTAATTLRPSGKARIDGVMLNVMSEGSYITPGTPIEVVGVEGSRIIVRAANV